MTASTIAKQTWRPMSLAEVVERSEAQGHIDIFLREFLDSFYVERDAARRIAMLQAEPRVVANEHANAYLAAVAEYLSQQNGSTPPPWVNGANRFLRRAFFPAGLESLKATLLMESPPAFRRRMIFVDADPLSRPRRQVAANAE